MAGEDPKGPGAAAAPNPWSVETLGPEDRGWLQNKAYDGLASTIRAYRSLEGFRGVPAERLLKLPEKEDDAEGWGALYGKLGRPDKHEEYGIEGADPELLQKVWEAGLTQRQVAALATYFGERGKAAQEKAAAERGQKSEAEIAALQREWGQEWDANIAHSQRGRAALGWDDETVDALEAAKGSRWVLEHLTRVGRGLKEDGFAGPAGPQRGGAAGFSMTREAAAAQLRALEGNPDWQKRRWSDDLSVRTQATEERARLSRIANPDPS